jgi:hypothetical protein
VTVIPISRAIARNWIKHGRGVCTDISKLLPDSSGCQGELISLSELWQHTGHIAHSLKAQSDSVAATDESAIAEPRHSLDTRSTLRLWFKKVIKLLLRFIKIN